MQGGEGRVECAHSNDRQCGHVTKVKVNLPSSLLVEQLVWLRCYFVPLQKQTSHLNAK